MTDAEIIELYISRDESAIAESDAQYGQYCRQIAMNMLSDNADAEECVSSTWKSAWDSMPSQNPDSLAAFFGRIVRNLAIGKLRFNRARRQFDGITLLLSELEDCVPSRSSDAQEVERRMFSETLDRWLAELPVDDRVLFIRRYWFGEAIKALAKECRMTQRRMARRMLRLRKGLRATLESEGIYI
ncbi:MAG: sigma-70 family RNA polymerase sigma factor [Oscillospiraceae bacterium]|nr:sigma-70 family RNA polymerase sigma factor [Oscillospiraceae bacterium]